MLIPNLLSHDSFLFMIIDQGLNVIFERLSRKLTSPDKLLSSVQHGQIPLGWKIFNGKKSNWTFILQAFTLLTY